MALLADACAELGDAPRARRLYDLLLPYEKRHAVAGFGVVHLGSIARGLGLLATQLGRYDEAEGHFETALEAETRCGARPWLVEARIGYARMLHERGDVDDRARARALARDARESAVEMGMSALSRVAEDLERSGRRG